MLNKREKWTDYFFKEAELIATRSTCVRRQVGCVIVNEADKRILSKGFNGAPAGVKHCTEETCLRKDIPSGQDLDRCMACLHGDTKIKLLNGTSVPIKDLVGKEVWGYGYDDNTGKIIPVLIKNIHVTKQSKVIELTFDDDTTLKVTPDHKILMRDETYKNAEDILINEDSIMPGRWKNSNNPWFDGYEEIYHPLVPASAKNQKITMAFEVIRYLKCYNLPLTEENYNTYRNRKPSRVPTIEILIERNYIESFDHLLRLEENCIGEYQLTHQMVADFFDIKGENIHHIDLTKNNNEPDNLIGLSRKDHKKLHPTKLTIEQYRINGLKGIEAQNKKILTDPVFRQKKSEHGRLYMNKNWANPKFREKIKIVQSKNGVVNVRLLNSNPEIIRKRNLSMVLKKMNILISKIKDIKLTPENYEQLRMRFPSYGKGNNVPFLSTILKFFPSVEEAIEKAYAYNHTVKTKKMSTEEVPVYDFTVDTVHNALFDLGNNTGIFLHNCHSEANAIATAAKHGIKIDGCVLYCTHKPCSTCIKYIINSGIKKVYYKNEYPSDMTELLVKDISSDFELIYVK